MRTNQRGSALIVAMVVILVITVIGVGMMRIAGQEVAGAYAGAHEQALVACADAARLQLLSKFQALGFQAAQVKPLNDQLGAAAGHGQTMAVGGHYDTPVDASNGFKSIVVDQVSYLPENSFGPTSSARDLSSISSLVGQGGKPLKVVVHCQDGPAGSGRQLEVEFGIRFGL